MIFLICHKSGILRAANGNYNVHRMGFVSHYITTKWAVYAMKGAFNGQIMAVKLRRFLSVSSFHKQRSLQNEKIYRERDFFSESP